MSWRDFVTRLNPDIYTPRTPHPKFQPPAPRDSGPAGPSNARSKSPSRPPPTSSSPRSRFSPAPAPAPDAHAQTFRKEVDGALDFLEQIMHPESVRRLAPREALYHPFLREDSEGGDDEFFPHRHGEGVCGEWHEWDGETGQMFVCVRVRQGGDEEEEEWTRRFVVPGEAVAVGRRPCQFHRAEDGYEYE